MRRRGHAAIDHEYPADDADCCAECRTVSPPCDCELGAEEWMRESLRVLARNLRDAAGCALAFDLGERLGAWHFNQMDKSPAPWDSNRAGQPAPRWGR